MRIIIEAHHPAHIHFWKYPIRELQKQGHKVLMVARDRDVMRRLLEAYDWIPAIVPKRSSRRWPLASGGVWNVRRYQQPARYPSCATPLAGVSGAKGTSISDAQRSGGAVGDSPSGTMANCHLPLSDHHVGLANCGLGWS